MGFLIRDTSVYYVVTKLIVSVFGGNSVIKYERLCLSRNVCLRIPQLKMFPYVVISRGHFSTLVQQKIGFGPLHLCLLVVISNISLLYRWVVFVEAWAGRTFIWSVGAAIFILRYTFEEVDLIVFNRYGRSLLKVGDVKRLSSKLIHIWLQQVFVGLSERSCYMFWARHLILLQFLFKSFNFAS